MEAKDNRRLIESFSRDASFANAFESLFENASDAIYILDKRGNFVAINRKAEELTGFKREDWIGKSFRKIVPAKSLPKAIKGFLNVIRGKSIRFELELKTAFKKTVLVEVTSKPLIINGKIVGTLGITRDITERKQMEKKLQEYSEHLEELVEKRTKQLKEAHEQLLKSERLAAIGEIAAMVGHDLRNPLTGIAAATYYLKTKLGPKMDKTAKEMLDLIEEDIEHSSKIISDLLDYSKEIRLELTETTPKSIIKGALTLLKIPKNIRILDLTEDKPEIKTDVEKMKRVFINIIKNAIDAMPEGGKLTIKSIKTNSKLETTFADTGTGIPQDILEKIWTPLFTTKAKGIGLGLPICKRIVDAHKGNISVESTVGKGTTFTITIPLEPELKGGEKAWLKGPESLLSTTTKA